MTSDTAIMIQRLKKLFVPIIADILDEMGVTENVFSPDI
jgi:hypothetical protein